MIEIKESLTNKGKLNTYITATITLCIGMFILTNIISRFTYIIFPPNIFLTIHFLVEVFSILVSLCIFTLLYFTYDIFNNLRNIILANIFLSVGFIDIFHTLSYDGMPLFFTSNCPQKATAYWIIARIILSLGIFICSIIPMRKKTYVRKEYLLIFSIMIISFSWYIVIYQPQLIPTLFIEGQGLTPMKIGLEYFVIGLQLVAVYFYLKDYKKNHNELMLTFIIAIIISIFSELAFTLYIYVIDVFNLLGHILKIIAYFLMFRALFIANVRKPYIKLAEVRNKLNEYAITLETKVSDKTNELLEINNRLVEANTKLMADLDAGRNIQQALLPTKELFLNEVSFYSKYIPCEKLSGDLYNYIKIDEENIGMYIVDVSGHGLSAAMLTVFANRVLSSIVHSYKEKNIIPTPKDILESFYEIYNNSNFPNENHLVMIYGIYNVKDNIFTYSSAGHNCPPILISKGNGTQILDTGNGFPICKLGNIYSPQYTNYIVEITPGDRILFYTDGITELKNKKEDMYSLERLVDLLKQNYKLSSESLINEIEKKLFVFNNSCDIDDDISYFIMDTEPKTT